MEDNVGLSLDNILDENDLELLDNEEEVEETKDDYSEEEYEDNSAEDNDPEGVGSEEQGEEEDTYSEENGSSPNDFFSSIAEALAEEGILPDLDEDTIKEIKTPEDLRGVINNYIQSELTERQRRVDAALSMGAPVDEVKRLENTIAYLDNISEDFLREESDNAEDIRKRLIYQDYINRGFSQARAEKAMNKSVSDGTDVEDAIEALASNKEYYASDYNKLLEETQQRAAEEQEIMARRAEEFKKSIMNSKGGIFEDLDLDKQTRQRIYDNITKPVYKDAKTGEVYTELQRYQRDNYDKFLATTSLLYTLTNGFTDLDRLTNKKVKKELKKGFRELERKINTTTRNSFGDLEFTSGSSDPASYFGKGLKFDF